MQGFKGTLSSLSLHVEFWLTWLSSYLVSLTTYMTAVCVLCHYFEVTSWICNYLKKPKIVSNDVNWPEREKKFNITFIQLCGLLTIMRIPIIKMLINYLTFGCIYPRIPTPGFFFVTSRVTASPLSRLNRHCYPTATSLSCDFTANRFPSTVLWVWKLHSWQCVNPRRLYAEQQLPGTGGALRLWGLCWVVTLWFASSCGSDSRWLCACCAPAGPCDRHTCI